MYINTMRLMTVNIWKSYMCIAVRKRIYAILAAMNTTERVVEIRLGKKIQARTGLKYENCLSNMVWTNTWSKKFWDASLYDSAETSDNGIIREVEWRNSTKLNITKAVESRMRSLKSALYRTIYQYSFAIETSFSVECCLLNHSGPKRTLRRVNLIYFVDRKEHAIPLFVDAKILPITFLYYEAVCKLMFDVHNDSAPSNVTFCPVMLNFFIFVLFPV